MPSIRTTAVAMAGGVDAVTGSGQVYQFTFGESGGNWATGEKVTLSLVDSLSGVTTQVGAGDTTGITPSFAFTFKGKMYVTEGSTYYFSDVDEPTEFNDPEGLEGRYVDISNNYATPEDIVALASYQGRMSVFTRHSVQIWEVNADPTAYALVQSLPNVGTVAKLSVQALGDLDVFFLADTGIRSLRVRDSSNNAFVSDVGSPIDALVQAKMQSASATQLAAACGVVEPNENRYWLFLKDTIYVLSYFPSAKIVAWSEYLPTYESAGVQTTFTPQKFLVAAGKVYIRDASAYYVYGGAAGTTYDNAPVVVETPWLDNRKPATTKSFKAVDYSMDSMWTLQASTDYLGLLKFTNVAVNQNKATFDRGRVGWSSRGTHFKLRATCSAAAASKLSSLIVHYDEAPNK